MNDKFSQPLYCQCFRTGPYNLTIPIYGLLRKHAHAYAYTRAYARIRVYILYI